MTHAEFSVWAGVVVVEYDSWSRKRTVFALVGDMRKYIGHWEARGEQ